jgi:response regulator RpfG family c-di-GMP phosphodiesterase
MTLFQNAPSDPRTASAHFADVLAVYGAIGDIACGNPSGFALRKASAAASLARSAQLEAAECDAVYFAGLLHAVGAIDSPAYRKGAPLSGRVALMESWDVPALGARACTQIRALPPATADIVRWQSECWDGTGYPDALRWNAIPRAAMVLALADGFVRASDPDDALVRAGEQSGRAYNPDLATIFTRWYHLGGDAVAAAEPLESLRNPTCDEAGRLLDFIADRVDAHNGVDGRWRRIERLTQSCATTLQLDAQSSRALAQAVRLYGAGEIGDPSADGFDPLARLGVEQRAKHALAAAALVHEKAAFAGTAELLRARSEWYDGSGRPGGLLRDAIPSGARVLAAAIAYDALDRKDRIEDATGTQFEARAVAAVTEAAKAGVGRHTT